MQNINIYCIRVHCTVLYNKYTAVGYSFAKFFIADFLSIDWMGGEGAGNAGKFNFANGFNCSVPIKPR